MNVDPKNVVLRLRNKFPDDGSAGSFLPNEAADLIELQGKQRDEMKVALQKIYGKLNAAMNCCPGAQKFLISEAFEIATAAMEIPTP